MLSNGSFFCARRVRLTALRLASTGAFASLAACGDISDDTAAVWREDEAGVLGSAAAGLSDFGLQCRLWPSEGSSRDVRMTLENHGDLPVELFTRGTLWDNLTRVLSVRDDANELPYLGVMSSRGEPVESEFLRVEPGQLIATEYDVPTNHELASKGRYDLTLASPILGVKIGGELLTLQHDCGQLSAVIDPEAASALSQSEQPLIWVEEDCTAAQQSQVDVLENIARAATEIGAGATAAGPKGPYQQWFGAPTAPNLAIVNEVFASTEGNWDDFTGECDTSANCAGSVNAWTQRSVDPDLVHLCSPFFTLPSLSIEAGSNQVGVLMHEKSHLNPGTVVRDESNATWCSGTCNTATEARDLAANASSQAVTNGENYEHFVSTAYIAAAIVTPTGILFQ